MKFEFEKMSIRLIERRIEEAERGRIDKKQVVTVVLTPPEWYELLANEGMIFEPPFGRNEIQFSPRERMKFPVDVAEIAHDFRRVRIVLEGYE